MYPFCFEGDRYLLRKNLRCTPKKKPLDLISVDFYVHLLLLETIHKRVDLF